MGLADYYQRGALAAAQVLAGFNEDLFRETLLGTAVGITLGADSLGPEGLALTDLLVRLTARLYPSLAIRGDRTTESRVAELRDLACAINPAIDLDARPTVEIVVGIHAPRPIATTVVFAGSAGWDARISLSDPQPVGESVVPFGAGASACLAAANVFRLVFLGPVANPDGDTILSTYNGGRAVTPASAPTRADLRRSVVLAGCGAIGNAAVWSLGRADATGIVSLVDHEPVELGNLQRYVLTTRADEGRPKVEVASGALALSLRPAQRQMTLANFLAAEGYDHDRVLLALDSARDRRQAQASLPRWIANAWTQPGDLGVSVHRFGGGACVSCLYLPQGKSPNEDEMVAAALKVPERLMEVRLLLHTGGGVTRPLLEAAAAKLGVAIEKLLPFEDKPIRSLYVEGICGGAIIPLGEQVGSAPQNMHVPLAHQSALAGVLLAAALIREAATGPYETTLVTRIDVMSRVGAELTRPALADPRGICICQDGDYIARYAAKYSRDGDAVAPRTDSVHVND
jgi:hypothetical protein